MQLKFSHAGQIVGHFVDTEVYPTTAGDYRYMPYRGPGHLALQEECERAGFGWCAYPTPTGPVRFKAQLGSEPHVLTISNLAR